MTRVGTFNFRMTGGGSAVRRLASAAVAGSASICHAGAPPNDSCSNAIAVELGENPYSTVDATTTGPNMCASMGRDVWFKFSSNFNGPLRISTCDDPGFDTIVAVYSGCGCSGFNLLGCNDDVTNCPDGGSRLIGLVEAGNCYRIRLAGFQGQSGVGTLVLEVADPNHAAAANRIKTGAEAGDRFGFAVAGASAINNDALDDVLVGGPKNDMLGVDTGRVYALEGDDLGDLETLTGEAAGDNFGYSVASDCDVNADGRADMIIGAPLNDEVGVSAGKVYVYSGFDGSLLWERTGEAAGDRLGWSVGCAGDVNEDGFDDVIVGAPLNDAGGVDAGRAYVLDGEDGSILRTVSGQNGGDQLGWAVSGLGDLNGDGNDEFVVGIPRYDGPNGDDSGRVRIYDGAAGNALKSFNGDDGGDRFGSAVAGHRFTSGASTYVMLAAGAPNNDNNGTNSGRVRVYRRNLTTPSANPCGSILCSHVTLDGGNPGDRFGSSVDINQLVSTSIADIVVGAPQADLNGSNAGVAYVFSGSNGSLVERFHGEAPNDRFGTSVAAAGDVNDDGDADLVVGAPYNDAGGDNAGRAYVFFLDDGSANMMAPEENVPGPSIVIADGDPLEAQDSMTELPIWPAEASADLTGNGEMDAEDLVAMLAAWGPCAAGVPCPADLDVNGDVNVDDLLALMAAWE